MLGRRKDYEGRRRKRRVNKYVFPWIIVCVYRKVREWLS